MTELCPCGSERPLSDCCTSKTIAKMKERSLNGSMFPERITWADDYLNYKAMMNRHIGEAQEEYVRSLGHKIPCTAGCAMCCIEFIAARLEECDAIAMYLYSHPPLMNTFLTNYDPWINRISKEGNILQQTTEAYHTVFETRRDEDRETFSDRALDYAKRYAHCPFLDDHKCMIYPIRPFVCSTYTVLSDKTYCDPKGYEQAPESKIKLKSRINPLSFEHSYYADLKGRIVFGAMPKMVYDILTLGHQPLHSRVDE